MNKFLAIIALIVAGIFGRVIPHPPNATPITAITITARRELGGFWVYAIPLIAMVLSDAVIGFYDFRILASVYISFALIALLTKLLPKDASLRATFLVAVLSSVLFFLITNWAVWLFSPWYAKSFAGLLSAYALGLPFLRTMLLGDLVYTGMLTFFAKKRYFVNIMNITHESKTRSAY